MPVKVCPFCMVDARTDAACCAYCGSRYDRVGSAVPHVDESGARRRTYNGTPHVAGSAETLWVSLDG